MDDALQLKLLTIGDSMVGKSWLLLRWSSEGGKFEKQIKTAGAPMATIGVDFKNKNVEIEGRRVKLQIWDTAGQERYKTITQSYYRQAHGILLVYDITNAETFQNIKNWMDQIQKNAESGVNKVLIGNKCDLQRQRAVTYDEGESLAREYNIAFFETSAMNDINVDHAFMALATAVKRRLDNQVKTAPVASPQKAVNNTGGGVVLDSSAPKPKKSFC